MARFCEDCGAQLSEGARSCPSYGAGIAAPTRSPTAQTQASRQEGGEPPHSVQAADPPASRTPPPPPAPPAPTAAAARQQPPTPPPKPSRGLIIAAVVLLILAFVIPLLTAVAALVIGILLIPRRQVAAGVTIMVLSVVCGFVGLFVIQAVFVSQYRVPSEAMEPTIKAGDRVLINRLSRSFSVGDIVAFNPPTGAQDNRCGVPPQPGRMCPLPTRSPSDVVFIKRIVAVPGDTVAMRDGLILVNGQPERAYKTKPCSAGEECNFPTPIRVPAGDYLLIGDNRGASDDSRFWGPVPKAWIIGKKFGPTY